MERIIYMLNELPKDDIEKVYSYIHYLFIKKDVPPPSKHIRQPLIHYNIERRN